MKRRMGLAALLLALLLFGSVVRLAWLQLVSPAAGIRAAEDWKRGAVAQHQRRLVLDTGRGDFVDRYGRAITGETYQALALFPIRPAARGNERDMAVLADILGVEPAALRRELDGLREAKFWRREGEEVPYPLSEEQIRRLSGLTLGGVRVLPYRNRYPASFPAKHAIGYISQHPELVREVYAKELAKGTVKLTDTVGGGGLERSLDRLLRGTGATSVSYFIDGTDRPLRGLGIRVSQSDNPYYPLRVVTTLDLKLQNALEAYADANGLREGAIVVLDAANADVLAMVSRPSFDPWRLDDPAGPELANHAIRAVEPGSVFKLVTAAAALEYGVADENHEQFECDGEYGKYGLSCWKPGGHGLLTLREGLAQSCNIVFATLAERLTAAQINQTADRLGIGRQIGWSREEASGPLGALRLLEEEEAGTVFAGGRVPSVRDGGLLVQTGIGQRDVRVTPLQAANLVVTLLNGGRVMEPRLVSEIRYANGQRMAALAPREGASRYGRVSPAVTGALLRGMEAVVARGTGQSIREGAWAVAGKSGTAETSAAAARNHQWFAGYGPVQSPRYAVAVLAANRPPDSANRATALFRGVMDVIAAHEKAGKASR